MMARMFEEILEAVAVQFNAEWEEILFEEEFEGLLGIVLSRIESEVGVSRLSEEVQIWLWGMAYDYE